MSDLSHHLVHADYSVRRIFLEVPILCTYVVIGDTRTGGGTVDLEFKTDYGLRTTDYLVLGVGMCSTCFLSLPVTSSFSILIESCSSRRWSSNNAMGALSLAADASGRHAVDRLILMQNPKILSRSLPFLNHVECAWCFCISSTCESLVCACQHLARSVWIVHPIRAGLEVTEISEDMARYLVPAIGYSLEPSQSAMSSSLPPTTGFDSVN